MSAAVHLPGFTVIARALRDTTELLAQEIVQPSATAPPWSDFEWGVARAVCAMHGFATLLANRLHWRGPAAWSAFLEDQRSHSRAHYEGAGEVLAALNDAAQDAGIACIALKGSALRALQIHLPGERPMADIDLLVGSRDAGACSAMLTRLGYEAAGVTPRHATFIPVDRRPVHHFGEHLCNPLKIDLHTRITERLPIAEVDVTAQLWPAQPHPGINGYASTAALLRHLLLHAAGNLCAHSLRFIQLYDIARLALRMQALDWAELLGPVESRADSWWMYPPLLLAQRYVPGSIGPEVLAAFGEICPRWLRGRARRYDLSEVSLSNLRIGALPGYEWVRTPRELLHYAKSRVLPGRVALKELDDMLRAQPSYAAVRWYDASHGERILRWLFSRPPRVQTIVSVRAALDAVDAPGVNLS